jgi:hypothetical protein
VAHRPAVSDLVSALVGKTPWGLRRGVGSFLTMEFGLPDNNLSGKLMHGEWHLWLYHCNWRIEIKDTTVASSEFEPTIIDQAIQTLRLSTVRQAEVSNPSFDLSLYFDPAVRLLTLSSSADHDQEQWMLFMPDGNCLTAYGDGNFDLGRINEPRLTG